MELGSVWSVRISRDQTGRGSRHCYGINFTNKWVVSVIAGLRQLPSPNALSVLRYKRSPLDRVNGLLLELRRSTDIPAHYDGM